MRTVRLGVHNLAMLPVSPGQLPLQAPGAMRVHLVGWQGGVDLLTCIMATQSTAFAACCKALGSDSPSQHCMAGSLLQITDQGARQHVHALEGPTLPCAAEQLGNSVRYAAKRWTGKLCVYHSSVRCLSAYARDPIPRHTSAGSNTQTICEHQGASPCSPSGPPCPSRPAWWTCSAHPRSTCGACPGRGPTHFCSALQRCGSPAAGLVVSLAHQRLQPAARYKLLAVHMSDGHQHRQQQQQHQQQQVPNTSIPGDKSAEVRGSQCRRQPPPAPGCGGSRTTASVSASATSPSPTDSSCRSTCSPVCISAS